MLPITKPSESQEQVSPSLLEVHQKKKKKRIHIYISAEKKKHVENFQIGERDLEETNTSASGKGFSGSLALTKYRCPYQHTRGTNHKDETPLQADLWTTQCWSTLRPQLPLLSQELEWSRGLRNRVPRFFGSDKGAEG